MKTMVLLFCSLVVLGVCVGCTSPSSAADTSTPSATSAPSFAPGATS